ncbi:unnamed protein product, partial [Owenia fusiformis]
RIAKHGTYDMKMEQSQNMGHLTRIINKRKIWTDDKNMEQAQNIGHMTSTQETPGRNMTNIQDIWKMKNVFTCYYFQFHFILESYSANPLYTLSPHINLVN